MGKMKNHMIEKGMVIKESTTWFVIHDDMQTDVDRIQFRDQMLFYSQTGKVMDLNPSNLKFRECIDEAAPGKILATQFFVKEMSLYIIGGFD